MYEISVAMLVFVVALIAFVRALIIIKYSVELNKSQLTTITSIVTSLIAFKKNRPVVGMVLMVASVAQLVVLVLLGLVLLSKLFII